MSSWRSWLVFGQDTIADPLLFNGPLFWEEVSFPKQGEVVEVEESGMFSSDTKEMWTIDDGRPIPMEKTYDPVSSKDIYGFKDGETRPEDAINSLKTVRRALVDRHDDED